MQARFNRRHRRRGPLFGGRYKAQHIGGRSGACLVTACDSVHLNPARAGQGRAEERAAERRPTHEQQALRMVREALAEAGIAEAELLALPQGDPRKVASASRLRAETPMTRLGLAARWAMGSASSRSALLKARVDDRQL